MSILGHTIIEWILFLPAIITVMFVLDGGLEERVVKPSTAVLILIAFGFSLTYLGAFLMT